MGDFSLEQFMKPYKTKRQQKIEEQKDVLGVCLVGKRMSAGSYQGVCSGSVVRGLLQFKEVRNKVFLIVSDNALSKKDLDNLRESKSCHSIAEKYTLFFIDREDSSKLKTYDLHEITSEEEEVMLDVGLVIIPIDHDARKLNKKSGILDYRPFPVNKQSKERNASLGNEICQIVEGNTSCFAVTTLDLEPTGENYLLRLPGKEIGFETLTDLQASIKDLHPRGAVILRKGEVVGVLNFVDDKIVPLYFATLQVFGYAGSIKNQVGDGDWNSTADPKKAVKTLDKQPLALEHVAESVNISSSETHQPTAKHEMTPNESSSNKGKSPSEDVNEIGDKGKGSKEQTTGDQKSLPVTIDKSLNELASFNATTSKDSSQASGVQVDHNTEERQLLPSKTNQVADFKTSCSKMGFIVVDNDGQGNCMFIALSNQLALKGISTDSYKELRQSSVDYLRKNPKMQACGTELSGFFENNKRFSWSEYLEDMAKEGTWGDNMTLYAVANCYGVSIRVISSLSRAHDRIIRPGPQCAVNTELVVGHIDEFHYFSLRPNYGVIRPTVREPTSKASPVVSGRSSYKPSFPAKIGLDKTNVRDNKTLPSNKDSGLDEGNNQARSNAAKPVTNTFHAPRDAAFFEEEANAKKLNRLLIEGGTAPVLNTPSQTEDLLGSKGQLVLDTASQKEDLQGSENRALLKRASQQGEETEGVPRDAASTSPSSAFCEEEANAKKLNRLLIEGRTAPALDTASQTDDIQGGEDRALLERASQQGEETEGGVTPPTVGEPPSKASPVVSGQPLYKRSFSAKIGGDKILDETNFRDNKTPPSNKDSCLDERNVAAKYEGNDQARSNVTEPGTNTFPAPRDAAATSSLVASSEEEENTKKLNRLLTEGGAAALRKVFDDRHPPEQLQDHLKASQSTLKKLLDDKTLNEHQWLKLFPRDGATPESKNFDFFLLFILLTTTSGLRNPPPKWRRSPPKRINTLAAQIARLRNFHDELYVGRTRINNATFSSLWREISDVLVELGLEQTEIDSFKDPCAQGELLGRVDERKLVDIYSEMQAKVLQELEYFRKAVDAQSVSRTTTGSREVKDTASQTEDLLGSEGQPVLDTASQTEDLPGGENRALLERTSQQGEETEGDASPERLVSLPLQSIYDDLAERQDIDENADLNTLHHILMVLFCTIISVGLRTLFWG